MNLSRERNTMPYVACVTTRPVSLEQAAEYETGYGG